MTHYQDGDSIFVPRNRLFVLKDGRFVIHWEKNRVQDLLSGRYLPFTEEDFGNAITDYELNQLQNSGIVARYDADNIYLQPEVRQFHGAGRTYYLNTTLHKSNVDDVTTALASNQHTSNFSVRVQGIFVIIRGPSGMAFRSFDQAERTREILIENLPDLLGNTVVAFVEIITAP